MKNTDTVELVNCKMQAMLFSEIIRFVVGTVHVQNRLRRRSVFDCCDICHTAEVFCHDVDLEVVVVESVSWRRRLNVSSSFPLSL